MTFLMSVLRFGKGTCALGIRRPVAEQGRSRLALGHCIAVKPEGCGA